MHTFFVHSFPAMMGKVYATVANSAVAASTAAAASDNDNETFQALVLSLHCFVLWVLVVFFLVAAEATTEDDEDKETEEEEEEEEEGAEEFEEEENMSAAAAADAPPLNARGGAGMSGKKQTKQSRLLESSARAKDWSAQRKEKKEKKKKPAQVGLPVSGGFNEEYKKCLQEVVAFGAKAMRSADIHGIFLNLVTDTIAPRYSIVIKEPMCIKVIEDKAAKKEYRHLSEFEHDVHLMFDNCIKYNNTKEGRWYRNEAKRQEKVWDCDIMPQVKDLLYKKGYCIGDGAQ